MFALLFVFLQKKMDLEQFQKLKDYLPLLEEMISIYNGKAKRKSQIEKLKTLQNLLLTGTR